MYNCKHCGAPLTESDYKCPYCGAVVTREASVEAEVRSRAASVEAKANKKRRNLPKMRYVHLTYVILLSIFTLGFYSIYWFFTRRKTLDKLVPDMPFSHLVWILLGVWVLAILIGSFGGIAKIITFGIQVYMAFTIRNILRRYALNYFGNESAAQLIAPSGVLLFFFGVIYLQYHINKMINMGMLDVDIL